MGARIKRYGGNFDYSKFRNVVMYILKKISGTELGTVRLNKILWFSDLNFYLNTGNKLTYDTYIKKDRGPVSSHLMKTLDGLVNDGLITHTQEPRFPGLMHIIHLIADFDDNNLSVEERKVIDGVIQQVKEYDAKTVSDISHIKTWEHTKADQPISFRAVLGELDRSSDAYENINWGA